jgi:1-acyl-sn-glycerol-3-phosphate acyltransferase
MTRDASAILFLIFVVVVPVGWLMRLSFRRPFTPSQWLLYFINILLVRLLWRADSPKRLPIRDDQGAVIICNHRSSIDPCFMQVVAGRRIVHWMVAQLYSQHSLIGWMLRRAEIIPVRRHGRDTSATKAAIRLAANGELVGMLPEGTINITDEFMRPIRPGAVLVALKARVPIIPCYIEGSPYHDVLWRPLFMPARVRLKVGPAIDLSEYFGKEREDGVLAQLAIECIREIAKLAGQNDFEPRLAGRNWKTWQ